MSLIARTAGIGRSAPELQWDLNYLLKLWDAIDGAAKGGKGAFLIYQESSLVIRAIRDYFTADIGEILIDTDDIYDQAQQFMTHVMPETASKVKRYRDDAPLFSPLPDRAPDRDGVRAHGQPALGRRDRDRPHRGAGLGRRQLGALDARQRHRGNRDPHQPRSRRRDRAPDAPARPRRPDRRRLHRHGRVEEPPRGRDPAARRAAPGPRPRAVQLDQQVRPARNEPPAPAPGAQRRQPHHLPALQRHRPHPRHRELARCRSCAWSRKSR